MNDRDLIELGFEKDVFFHMVRFIRDGFEVWYNTKCIDTGYYCSIGEEYTIRLTVCKLMELYNQVTGLML